MPATRPADLYDAFYDLMEKDYRWEAKVVRQAARTATGRKAKTLLDVACGTGRHIEHFSRKLRCVGVDVNRSMLAVARRRCPDVRFVRADMAELALGEQFDVVTCLFSSVAYMRTTARLRRAIRAMGRHVAPGGALVIEPWYQPDQWDVGHLSVLTVDEPARKAVRMSRSTRRGDLSALDFEYLIGEPGGIARFRERHELRLFTWDHYVDAFEAAGFGAEIDEVGLWGHGLIVGVRHG